MSDILDAQTRPMGLYLHWPFCSKICPYCDFNVYLAKKAAARGQDASLLSAMRAELKYWHQRLDSLGQVRPLTSIFLGGGTPSLMTPDMVAIIIEDIKALFGLTPNSEITMEANPTDAEGAKFSDFAAAGINRLSLGVQSLDEKALKFLGRNHGPKEALKAMEKARMSFDNLSFDAIYALPNQTATQLKAQWARFLAFEPDHFSPYQLTIETGTAFGRAVAKKRWLPASISVASGLYQTASDILAKAGLTLYEISNHAKGKEKQSAHNLIYWHSHDWIGLGPGSHGRLGPLIGQKRFATSNIAKTDAYISAINQYGHGLLSDEPLDQTSIFEEYYLMGLRLADGIAMLGADENGPMLNPARLAKFIDEGLVADYGGKIALTQEGRLLADHISGELLT